MPCDYYIEKSTVIEYMGETGNISILVYNVCRTKGYISSYSIDMKDIKNNNYINLLNKSIKKHTYIKILYDKTKHNIKNREKHNWICQCTFP